MDLLLQPLGVKGMVPSVNRAVAAIPSLRSGLGLGLGLGLELGLGIGLELELGLGLGLGLELG